MREQFLKNLWTAIDESDKILIGIGDEWKATDDDRRRILIEVYGRLAERLEGCDYFIITSCDDGVIRESRLNHDRITAPYFDGDDGEKQWNQYNNWIQHTLNHKLVLIELGEGFETPNLIRWPFENITVFNLKSALYRIHAQFPNLPDNVAQRAASLEENSFELMKAALSCE